MRHHTAPLLRRAALLLVVAATVARPAAAQQSPPHSSPADVRFMQGMIHHHAQAILMAGLIPARTTRDAMKLIGERIDVAQRDEIATMSTWLAAHHQPVPSSDHEMADMPGMTMTPDSATMMPGMASPAQLDSLRAARGTAFDRLFLTYMIRHHEGALKMVADLFAATGAGQDSDVFRMASDIDVDQRAEIARMQQLLATLPAR
jgi:uncharacterized protein (DUF305 family)